MWQSAVVVVLVASSAAYAVWILMPAAARARLAGWLAARLRRRDGPPGWLGAWLERKARPTAPPTGCDACPQSRIREPHDRGPPAAP